MQALGLGAFIAVSVVALDFLFPPPLERVQNISPLVVDREGRWVHAFQNQQDRWRFAADLESIDQTFVERLIAVEDKRFWRHPGIDAAAVLRATLSSVRAGRVMSGASTLTMQTARLLEPRPRTFGAKFIEMLRALQIERRLTKQEILELYLTLAPYGGNLEGVRAASLSYFGKEPLYLTDAEQALLIALPQAPEARRPDRHAVTAKAARQAILNRLSETGMLDHRLAVEAGDARIPSSRKPFARSAYHTSRRLAAEYGTQGEGVISSSLDIKLQRQAETIVRTHATRTDDGATAAALIIDNERREIRVAVGSSGLDAPGGWIDLTRAVRSPGSTLKPFIYALAFEDGIAGADTVIDDMPRSFGSYTPENFDRLFRGEVRVRDALQHSLNVPAVRTLDKVGARRFAAILSAAGVKLKTPTSANPELSLAIALGGAGVTAYEIASLYAALADDGEVRPLHWMTNQDNSESEGSGYRLMSEDTAHRVRAILAGGPSLAGRAPGALAQAAPRIAFKTGTSYGYRDAWSAGHAGRYTVVAWVGRADGAPRPGVTGRAAAAPLLFDLFDMLNRNDAEGVGDSQFNPKKEEAPFALARFNRQDPLPAPEIIFPRHGVEIFDRMTQDETRGFVLAARGGAGAYRWFVDGDPLDVETTSGRTLWRPDAPGFYSVAVVDEEGRSAQAKVRVISSG